MREVEFKTDLVDDELFFYLEEKVNNNNDSNEVAEMYEELMMTGKIHKKYNKIIRKLMNEMEN